MVYVFKTDSIYKSDIHLQGTLMSYRKYEYMLWMFFVTLIKRQKTLKTNTAQEMYFIFFNESSH